jgi:hypothetical protein
LRAEARRLAERVLQKPHGRPSRGMALEHSRRRAAASDSAGRWRVRSRVDAAVSPVRPRARSPASPQSGEVGRKALPSRGDIEDEPVVLAQKQGRLMRAAQYSSGRASSSTYVSGSTNPPHVDRGKALLQAREVQQKLWATKSAAMAMAPEPEPEPSIVGPLEARL